MTRLGWESPLGWQAGLLLVLGAIVLWLLVRWMAGPAVSLARRPVLWVLRGLSLSTVLLILLNPVRVTEAPGLIERPEMFYLVDSSQSMTLGAPTSRWEDAAAMMQAAVADTQTSPVALKLFRFGQRLQATSDHAALGLEDRRANTGSSWPQLTSPVSAVKANRPAAVPATPLAPTDSDTQLMTALRQISSRFGRKPPAGIVLFSDGQARDDAGLDAIMAQFRKLQTPVHVVPAGNSGQRGDISIVAAVVPQRVRRYSEVEVQVFLRSFGFDGYRTTVELQIPGAGDQAARPLASLPVTLRSGFQAVTVAFRTTSESHPLQMSVAAAEQEISEANNQLTGAISIDRTKIRVLYAEGSQQPPVATVVNGRTTIRGPFSDVSQALATDEDIECVVLSVVGGRLARVVQGSYDSSRGFPETKAELAAFDALILSDIPERLLTDTQLEWIEEWVGERGGGLLMAGGPRSFAAGDWHETTLADVLPVEMLPAADWSSTEQIRWTVPATGQTHAIWGLYPDERRTQDALRQIPAFAGANRFAAIKPNLTQILAEGELEGMAPRPPVVAPAPPNVSVFNLLFGTSTTTAAADENSIERASREGGANSALVAGRYGRGRTLAMATAMTPPLAREFYTEWKQGEQHNAVRFWRNTVYWLTENSSVGRRRLMATADKQFYSPGDTIELKAAAFSELARQTHAYRVVAMIEPNMALREPPGDYSPVKWPADLPRDGSEDSPFVAWGEEFEVPLVKDVDQPGYAMSLALAESLSSGAANQSIRLELTAYEELTQVDSTSLEIQILHDPFELQNPFPNHELLGRIATLSGGKVLREAADLVQVLKDVPVTVGPPIVSRMPLWSNWLLWGWLMALLTVEWLWRRRIGLA